MEPTRLVALAIGFVVVGLVLWDVFQTVVVPRPTPGVYRISRWVVRSSWRLVRLAADRKQASAQDPLLGMFGPAVALLLLLSWLTGLIVGYGLILFGLGHEINPPVDDLGTAMYFAAESLLTIGYGEITASGLAPRVIVIFAAITGLGVVAIVITFLFSLYASYQRREREVIALQATAGAPPSAVRLLSMYGRMGLVDRLPDFFITWQRWAAEVLDSHVAYPILGYFRASHDNLSWISALGTVLDASSLVATTIRGVPRGEAELCRRVGTHLVEDISSLGFREGEATPLTREEFDTAYRRLGAAGYELEPQERAWRLFERARAPYAAHLEQMARYWATPAAAWLGTRAPLRSPVHRDEDDAETAIESSVEAEAN
jgi:hypothetical protein